MNFHTESVYTTAESCEWYTPRWIFDGLDLKFDLDPCSPASGPVTPAREHYTAIQDGLLREWYGMVWLNPPYGLRICLWLNRMALHDRGVVLIFARTDTDAFHRYVFGCASGILFFRGRIAFCREKDGPWVLRNAGAPSCLVSYGPEALDAVRNFKPVGRGSRKGYFVRLK